MFLKIENLIIQVSNISCVIETEDELQVYFKNDPDPAYLDDTTLDEFYNELKNITQVTGQKSE